MNIAGPSLGHQGGPFGCAGGPELCRVGVALRRLNVTVRVARDCCRVRIVALIDRRVDRARVAGEAIMPASDPSRKRPFASPDLAVSSEAVGRNSDQREGSDNHSGAEEERFVSFHRQADREEDSHQASRCAAPFAAR